MGKRLNIQKEILFGSKAVFDDKDAIDESKAQLDGSSNPTAKNAKLFGAWLHGAKPLIGRSH